MRRVVYGVLFVPALAAATLGSVISSFSVPSGGPPTTELTYFDSASVYAVTYYFGGPVTSCILRRYTTGGSVVSSFPCVTSLYSDCDRSHLGANYIAVCAYDHIAQMNKSTGSFVQSFPATGPGGSEPECLAWDGRYYWVSAWNARGEFRKYTSAGSFAGNWLAAGWPAAKNTTGGLAWLHRFRNNSGNYLFVGSFIDDPVLAVLNGDTGALLTTFTLPARSFTSAMYADSSRPGTYGAALWLLRTDFGGQWSWETDIDARGGNDVLPASLGRIKATYR